MNSFKVMQFIYKMKSSVVAPFSVNLMYSVNFMSVKVMLYCTTVNHLIVKLTSPSTKTTIPEFAGKRLPTIFSVIQVNICASFYSLS